MKLIKKGEKLKEFPARSPSKIIFNKIEKPVIVGEPYYFQEDAEIDGSTIVGIRFHFFGGFFANFNLPQTYQIGAVNYNVAFFGEMRNTLITLCNSKGEVILEDQPCASLLANYGSIPNVIQNKYMRRFFIPDISMKASFLRFVAVPLTPLPFITPFNFFYRR